MRLRVFTLLIAAVALFGGCSDKIESLEVETNSYSVDYGQSEVTISISASGSWTMSADESWCNIPTSYLSGSGDAEVTLEIDANLDSSSRTAIVTISSGGITVNITISQAGCPDSGYSYEIPVVFHTIYSNSSNPDQYISAERIDELMEYLNAAYGASGNDMNVEFVLATHDPEGNALDEPGIDRVYMLNSVYDCTEFLTNEDETLLSLLLWDCNSYINIYTYTFTESSYLGLTSLAYCTTQYPIDGLVDGTYFLYNDMFYLHGVHLNNTYSNVDSYEVYPYNTCDFRATLTHEMGHYFGLYHAFTESGCGETDYCDDTPDYDQELYFNSLSAYNQSTPLAQLAIKCSCEGVEFTADNYMDYDFCLYNSFTADQRSRVRAVLENSPMVPGPKSYTKGEVTKSFAKPTPIIMR